MFLQCCPSFLQIGLLLTIVLSCVWLNHEVSKVLSNYSKYQVLSRQLVLYGAIMSITRVRNHGRVILYFCRVLLSVHCAALKYCLCLSLTNLWTVFAMHLVVSIATTHLRCCTVLLLLDELISRRMPSCTNAD